MANKILILFAHPRFERSDNNTILMRNIPQIPEITVNDLYERYPDFNIDVEYEKELLSKHDIIVWHHPLYWYSAPPLLKQWIDLVLEFGWAYGPGGSALRGKIAFNTITSGGPRSAYSHDGYNRFTLKEFLAPFDQTAFLCSMTYLPPFALHGTHKGSQEEKLITAGNYSRALEKLSNSDFSVDEIRKHQYMNDWIENINLKMPRP